MQNNTPSIIARPEHTVSRKNIDPDALKVLYRLKNHGYLAYLVGGGVRDLLLNRPVKDFDVATDALPSQLKKLFRNCRIVGRRFRLAHILFKDKILEVSTFRKVAEHELDDEEPESLLIREDNTFGTPEEDAYRRDFTVNGLFYDIASFRIIDYVGGMDDLKRRVVRAIGDPHIRFQEDPVRMLRAIRFAARLDFDLEADTENALIENRERIREGARCRLLEEVVRMLHQGAAARSFRMMHETGMLREVLPSIADFLSRTGDAHLFWQGLEALDCFIASGRKPLKETLWTVLWYLPFRELTAGAPAEEYWRILNDFIAPDQEVLPIPRRERASAALILQGFDRLCPAEGKAYSQSTMRKSYFASSLEVMEILSHGAEDIARHYAAWRALTEHQAQAVAVKKTEGPKKKRRRRRSRKPKSAHDTVIMECPSADL